MRRSPSWQLQFVVLAAIWGSSFLFIKLIGERWPPQWVAFGRVSLGAVTLLSIALARRERLAFGPRLWGHLAITAVLFNAVPFTLFAYGERHVSSIVAGLWNSTTPLWTLVFVALAMPGERPGARRLLGLMIGFLGAVVILMPWRNFHGGQLAGELACGGAALSYGLGFMYMRRFVSDRGDSAVALSAGQLVCATVLVAASLPLAGTPSLALGPARVGAILALGVLGSGIAYLLNFAVLRQAGPTVASTVTYLIPLFATALGIIVLGEPLQWNEPLGGAILLAGIALSRRGADTHDPAAGINGRVAVPRVLFRTSA